jgi:hypothetical protein
MTMPYYSLRHGGDLNSGHSREQHHLRMIGEGEILFLGMGCIVDLPGIPTNDSGYVGGLNTSKSRWPNFY